MYFKTLKHHEHSQVYLSAPLWRVNSLHIFVELEALRGLLCPVFTGVISTTPTSQSSASQKILS